MNVARWLAAYLAISVAGLALLALGVVA